VQHLDLLDGQARILVEELAQPEFAACLLNLPIPLRGVAPAEKATARAFDALLVAIADTPASTVLRLVGAGSARLPVPIDGGRFVPARVKRSREG
jgi:hypothetical protein